MTAQTILYIVIAGILAFLISVFMYGYRSKLGSKLRWLLGILRFLTLFTLFVLIINPKIRNTSYSTVKPTLAVLVDNSASIRELNQVENSQNLISEIKQDSDLNEQFNVSYYNFGSDLKRGDSISYDSRNTDLSNALRTASTVFRNDSGPIVILTDGNQTFGQDYEFSSRQFDKAVYPIILGDSIKYTDLRIAQLNTNRYAFLKNQFPIEVTMVYSGQETVSSDFSIRQGNSVLFSQGVEFSPEDNTKTLSINLSATSVGLQKYSAVISPLSEEKNRSNNQKQFAVEVIDEATNIMLISKLMHPDLGALRKSISSNEQRRITIKAPGDDLSDLIDYQMVILYQPDRSFSTVYEQLKILRKNTLTIAGTETDWDFLNLVQDNFEKDAGFMSEESSVEFNRNYGTFGIDDIGFDEFPPLNTRFGIMNVQVPHEVIFDQTVDGILSGSPTMATMEINGIRSAILDGENIWKWRAQAYLQDQEFLSFDDFIGRIIQYLASNKRRSRLEVSSESFYYNNNPIRISSQYFDNNFVFDPRASLNITVTNSETDQQRSFPMLLKGNFYEVDLSALDAGEYKYSVSVRDEAVSRSGSFSILDFDVEKQFLNADVTKLRRLATNTGGGAYFPGEIESLSEDLRNDARFRPVQKSEQKVVPLIDWKILLGMLVLLLAMEWFSRKYNGLI